MVGGVIGSGVGTGDGPVGPLSLHAAASSAAIKSIVIIFLISFSSPPPLPLAGSWLPRVRGGFGLVWCIDRALRLGSAQQ